MKEEQKRHLVSWDTPPIIDNTLNGDPGLDAAALEHMERLEKMVMKADLSVLGIDNKAKNGQAVKSGEK